MRAFFRGAVIAIAMLLAVGCAILEERDRSNSPDVALLKRCTICAAPEWDHVATIFGMADDMALCQDLVAAMRARHPAEQWSCSYLDT